MARNEGFQTNRRKFLGISVKSVLFTALLQLGLPFQAAAHSPKAVVLSYDAATRRLKVRITHSSLWPTFHYIEKVEIIKGGKAIASTEYTSQPDQETFTYEYPIEAAPGDILEVKASCSIFGSGREKLTVGK